jgi:rod shape determining protein RodA
MMDLKKFSSRSFDWVLMVAVLLLIAMGLEAIYSIDLSRNTGGTYFTKQLMAVGIGLFFVAIISMVQHTVFRSSAKIWYVASLILLVSVLIFGRSIRGTRGWFVVGGASFQPVEVAKLGVVLMLAYITSRFGRRFDRPLYFVGTGIVVLILMLLVMLQPDLGSAILLGIIWFGMMCLVGIRRRYLIILISAILLVGTLGWKFYLNDLQKARFTSFLNPKADVLGSGYNVIQSVIAVGSGQWFGKGVGRGSQSQLRFLPEAQTDFVFSVIAEEMGFVGVVVFLCLFGIILWRLLLIMRNSQDDFSVLTVGGICILLFSQFFINVGAEIGILPLTGVTVPFVSYGGSSMLIDLITIGIAQSMIVRKY